MTFPELLLEHRFCFSPAEPQHLFIFFPVSPHPPLPTPPSPSPPPPRRFPFSPSTQLLFRLSSASSSALSSAAPPASPPTSLRFLTFCTGSHEPFHSKAPVSVHLLKTHSNLHEERSRIGSRFTGGASPRKIQGVLPQWTSSNSSRIASTRCRR